MRVRSRRLGWGEAGGYVIAIAGLVAALTYDPAISVYYLSMAVMVVATAPVMVTFYELGGRTPPAPARGALLVALLTAVVFAGMFVALAAGTVSANTSGVASGPFAIVAAAMVGFGLWVAAASVLAGRWLTAVPRWLGILAGLAWMVVGATLILAGGGNPATTIAGLGFQVLFPIWGAVIGRRFAAIRSNPTLGPALPEPAHQA
jgi:hypothetical protein